MQAPFGRYFLHFFYGAILLTFPISFVIASKLDREEASPHVVHGSTGAVMQQSPCQSTDLMVMVPVAIDGKELCFHVDTGAQVTMVNSQSLGLVPPHNGSCPIVGAFGGSPPWCYSTTVAHIKVAGVTTENVQMAVVPLDHWLGSTQQVDGVLGIDFLKNYLFIIQNGELTLVQ